MSELRLPTASGAVDNHVAGGGLVWPAAAGRATSRTAYAAAHVVADPSSETVPGGPAAPAREATQAFLTGAGVDR